MSETILMVIGGAIVIGILLKEVAVIIIKKGFTNVFCPAHEGLIMTVSKIETSIEVVKTDVGWIRKEVEKISNNRCEHQG